MSEKIVIPYIEGDGTGEDIWRASKPVFDEAVLKATRGGKRIEWIPLVAGLKSLDRHGVLITEETLATIRKHRTAIKGPLTTPVGGGFRSVNVFLRQIFDLYVCMRPIRYFRGLPSPLKEPGNIDLVIFRENTEDLYRGIEWQGGTPEAKMLTDFLKDTLGVDVPEGSGIGIKPMSRQGTARFAKRGRNGILPGCARCLRRRASLIPSILPATPATLWSWPGTRSRGAARAWRRWGATERRSRWRRRCAPPRW